MSLPWPDWTTEEWTRKLAELAAKRGQKPSLVEKYAPDQLRDWHGRFADEGGGAARDIGPTELGPDQQEKTDAKIASGFELAMDKVRNPDGGFTFSIGTGSHISHGYALSMRKDLERVLPMKDVDLAALLKYAHDNRQTLLKRGNFIGAWHDPIDGMVYLDVSTVVGSAEEAERLGRANRQKAYYILHEGRSVDIDPQKEVAKHGRQEEAGSAFGWTRRGRAHSGRPDSPDGESHWQKAHSGRDRSGEGAGGRLGSGGGGWQTVEVGKYRVDQKRDYHGRFSEDGGGGDSSAKSEGVGKPDVFGKPDGVGKPEIADAPKRPGGNAWTPKDYKGKPSSAYPANDANGIDTEHMYKLPNGEWTPERKALHEEIIKNYFGTTTPVASPLIRVMGGGPASGKSVLRRMLGEENFVVSDADAIKEFLPEFSELSLKRDPESGTFVHEESSWISKEIARRAAEGKYNIAIDGTGDNSLKSLTEKVALYRAGGAKVVGEYVTIDVETALARAKKRGEETGRHVPEAYLREKHASVSSVLDDAIHANLFDEVRLWDTSVPEGTPPKQVAEQKGGKFEIKDRVAWNRFLAKESPGVGSFGEGEDTVYLASPDAVLGTGSMPVDEVSNYLRKNDGKEYKLAERPADVEGGSYGECYKNATLLALQHPDRYDYAEGYGYNPKLGGLGFLHAWVVDKQTGAVVDPTWDYEDGLRYFGVTYDAAKYKKLMAKAKHYGVLGSQDKTALRILGEGGLK